MSSHTVFLVQFEINMHLLVFFQKAEIALAEAARAISALWKNVGRYLFKNGGDFSVFWVCQFNTKRVVRPLESSFYTLKALI